jgi:hypothetical protein
VWSFPLLAEFLAGVLDASVEGVLLEIRNLYDVIMDGADARFFHDELAP